MLVIIAHIHAIAHDIRRHGLEHGGLHLAGQEARVDEAVEVVLLPAQKGLHAVGRMLHVRGTDGLMGVLCVFAALVLVGRFGAVVLAVLGADEAARRLDGLG